MIKAIGSTLIGMLLGVATFTQVATHPVKVREVELPLPPQVVKGVLSDKEVYCTAKAVYGESRGERLSGQFLVAVSVIKRTLSGGNTDSCAVVAKKGQYAGYKPKQKILEPKSWSTAIKVTRLASEVYFELDEDLRSIAYFDSAKRPSKFHSSLRLITVQGNHGFYAEN